MARFRGGSETLEQNDRIFVAGGQTLIGAALVRCLRRRGFDGLMGEPPAEPDLLRYDEVDDFFRRTRPQYVFFCAGKSGGILANQERPAELMLDNLLSECHVIDAAHRHGARKLLYVASSCSYPKHCPQPMRVESLMTGPLEPTNDAYATAKLAGISLCRAYARQHGARFISGIPANAFGIDDDFSSEGGHVIPALLARFHRAKLEGAPKVEIWGTGTPRREFVFADDLADACLFVMRNYDDPEVPINIGSGEDLSIAETAELIREITCYEGELVFDPTKPDGMPLKSLESSKLTEMGWRAETPIVSALMETYAAYQEHERSRLSKEPHVRALV
jgi:GDP-L-fucose synthase